MTSFVKNLLRVVAAMMVATAFTATAADSPRFDSCDVAYLWPLPTKADDVARLLGVGPLDDGSGALWPDSAFAPTLALFEGDDMALTHKTGRVARIKLLDEFRDRKNWKVAAIRIDPSAPGSHPDITAKFGSTPQIRLILQPVTVKDGKVTVHDVAAHLVYSFTIPQTPPSPVTVPDQVKFRAILDDLNTLKVGLKAKGIDTTGKPIGVHPGLSCDGADEFTKALGTVLRKFVAESNLTAVALMGLPEGAPEPWIFATTRRLPDGRFVRAPIPSLRGKSSEMLDFIDGEPNVVNTPLVTNRNPIFHFLTPPPSPTRGVATNVLFTSGVKLDAFATVGKDASGADLIDADLRNKDIPDLIANPGRAHFFNTDCVSCHTESTRRAILKLGDSTFRFQPAAGVSGPSPDVVPTTMWNVRNFGWGTKSFGADFVPTVTMRTANETADSVDFINRVYFAPAP